MEVWDVFKSELVLRKYAPRSVQTYVSTLQSIVSKIGAEPTLWDIKKHLSGISSVSTHKHHLATIRNYFAFVLKKKLSLKEIPYPRREQKIPDILSVDEIRLLFTGLLNFKHRAIVALLYGCGLRVSEVINIKISDVNSARMQIKVRAGKGKKDRVVPIDDKLLRLLRNYVGQYRPSEYLFNGQYGNQYSSESINAMLAYTAKRVGIKKPVPKYIRRLVTNLPVHLPHQHLISYDKILRAGYSLCGGRLFKASVP